MEGIIAHMAQPINWIEVITSACSILISVIAVIISINTYRSQKEHNKNSVRPILNIVLGDYEDDLYVRVDNNGVGPATISSIECTCSDDNLSAKSLVELIPYEASVQGERGSSIANMHSFTDFVEDITKRTIPPGGHITLLQIKEPKKNQLLAFRNYLNKCHVKISYIDIYNRKMEDCDRSLNFFGRHPIPSTIQIQYRNRNVL